MIGCPRSGTTALWRLLTAHSKIRIGVERFGHRAFREDFLSPELFEKERFFSPQQGDTFYKDLIKFNSWYAAAPKGYERAKYRGDKIPKLYTRLGKLYKNFPKAKVIFISRDIFDVANSYKARLEDPEDNWRLTTKDAVKDWNLSLKAAVDFQDNLLVVEYEGLFSRGEGCATIFKFLGLNFEWKARKRYSKLLARSRTLAEVRAPLLSPQEKAYIRDNADFTLHAKVKGIAINSTHDY